MSNLKELMQFNRATRRAMGWYKKTRVRLSKISPRFGDGMTNHERVQRQRIDSNRIGR